VFTGGGLNGFPNAQWHMDRIRESAGDSIEGMTAVVIVPGMLNFQINGRWITRQIRLIGIDEQTLSSVSDFTQYLQHPANRQQMSFLLREGGYGEGLDARRKELLEGAGWAHRRQLGAEEAERRQWEDDLQQRRRAEEEEARRRTEQYRRELGLEEPAGAFGAPGPGAPYPATGPREPPERPRDRIPQEDPFRAGLAASQGSGAEGEGPFDMARRQRTGLVLGIQLASIRNELGEEDFLVLPGDDVQVTVPTVGRPPKAVSRSFTIVDLYESKMSEYDANFVFVPIRTLQEMRGMIDPTTNMAMVNQIQIRLKPGADLNEVRDKIRAAFRDPLYDVQTWRDIQGPLLAAVEMETAILNILLFLIIAVAGFGILAIFFMIVVEKTRDIGVLKSLGASGRGVMGIFLAYGLSLGLVGSGVGLAIGLLLVHYINEIAEVITFLRGQAVFDPQIYFFQSIPTIVDPVTVAWIVGGAISIAVLASILPALRAAQMNPVEALRYE
jgi:lipoprotein-releasing system permease protein